MAVANAMSVHAFDHSDLHNLPEYSQVYRSLRALAVAMQDKGMATTQQEWERIVADMVSAMAYTDGCSPPGTTAHEDMGTWRMFPFRVDMEQPSTMLCYYYCAEHGYHDAGTPLD